MGIFFFFIPADYLRILQSNYVTRMARSTDAFFSVAPENVEPHGANKVAKKKLWEKTQVDLVTNQSREATWRGVVLTSSAGAVTCASLKGGGIS